MVIQSVERVGVIGAGTMGHGIAQVFARAGYSVILLDVDKSILDKALKLIREGPYGLMKLVEKGKLTLGEVEGIMSRIETTVNYDELCRDVDFVIECAPENPEMKKKIFNVLDGKCPEKTVLASNTSSIMISELASPIQGKERVCGMHFFNPAPVMPLVEVVKGPLTSEQTIQVVVDLARDLGKTPIEVNDVPGFFTTRFIITYLLEAIRIFEQGVAGIKEIDEMAKLAFGHPMGPFKLMDLIGLDTILHISEYLYKNLGEPHYKPPVTLVKLVLSGYLGDPRIKKGSRGGWYSYYYREGGE